MNLLWLMCGAALAAMSWYGLRQQRQLRRAQAHGDDVQARLDQALALLHALPVAVLSTDLQGVLRYLNPSAEAMLGVRAGSVAGRPVADAMTLLRDGVVLDVQQDVRHRLQARGSVDASPHQPYQQDEVVQLRRADGTRLDVEQRCTPLLQAGVVQGAVLILQDVSARRDVEARLQFIAHHDALTGLPNRLQFQSRLEHGIAYAKRHHSLLAVLFVDIDRFKAINDTLGHDVGDQVLIEFAARLQRCVRQVDTVARQGGDEFIVLLTEMRMPQDAERVAGEILSALAAPFVLGENSLPVAASVGMAIYPDDDDDVDALIEKADQAMYAAKHRGVGAWLRYAPSMQAKAYSRMILETALRHALEQQEFVLTYQPKLDLKAGRISGVKALLRWKHPELGMVMPLDFMPILEDSALILPVGAWVMATAAAQARRWIDAGQPLTVSVNLSARQFYQKDIVPTFTAILQEAGLPGHCVELEITESILIDKNQNCEAILRQFKQLGMGIAIGDFGTGYASLNYLKRFPVDVVKIDKSFIDDLHGGAGPQAGHAEGGAMVRAIIAMAHTLKMKVIASGVESRAQLALLEDMDCDEAFGYCISRAVAPGEIDALLKSRRQLATGTPAPSSVPSPSPAPSQLPTALQGSSPQDEALAERSPLP